MNPTVRAALEAARDVLQESEYCYRGECNGCDARINHGPPFRVEPHRPGCSWRAAMDLIEAALAEP